MISRRCVFAALTICTLGSPICNVSDEKCAAGKLRFQPNISTESCQPSLVGGCRALNMTQLSNASSINVTDVRRYSRACPGPCWAQNRKNSSFKLHALEQYMEDNSWPQLPIVQRGRLEKTGRKVLMAHVVVNSENVTGPVLRKHVEPILVSIETVRSLGSRHQIEYGVIVFEGCSHGALESLAERHGFRIFERSAFGVAADFLKIEAFNFEDQGYDRVAILDAGSFVGRRLDELLDEDFVYFTRSLEGVDSLCFQPGLLVASPSLFLYNRFRSILSTRRSVNDPYVTDFHDCPVGLGMRGLLPYVFDYLLPAEYGWQKSIRLQDQIGGVLAFDKADPSMVSFEVDARVYDVQMPMELFDKSNLEVIRGLNFDKACRSMPLDDEFHWQNLICRYFGALFILHLNKLQSRFGKDSWEYDKIPASSISALVEFLVSSGMAPDVFDDVTTRSHDSVIHSFLWTFSKIDYNTFE